MCGHMRHRGGMRRCRRVHSVLLVAGAGGCCLGAVAGCLGNQYCELGAVARCGPCCGTERSAASRCFPGWAPDLTNIEANSGIQMTTTQREELEALLRENNTNTM